MYNIRKLSLASVSLFVLVLLSVYITLGNFSSSPFFRLFGDNHFSLGLDLEGGGYLLLKVDDDAFLKEKTKIWYRDVLHKMREEGVIYKKVSLFGGKLSFILQEESTNKTAKIIKSLHGDILSFVKSPVGGGGWGTQEKSPQKGQDEPRYEVSLSDFGKKEILHNLTTQSMEIIRRRIDSTGVKEVSLYLEGDNIALEVPGVKDPSSLKRIINTTAKITFHLLNKTTPFVSTDQLPVGTDEKILPDQSRPNRYYVVKNNIEIDGSSLIDARAIINDISPAVSFRFDGTAARKFATITKQNINYPFAIVLDNKVISAPVIREPIITGSGVISGDFTLPEAKELALLLRAGALPAPINIIEESFVGPTLGAKSIKSGKIAFGIAMLLVCLFMCINYKSFGVISCISLAVNIFFIIAVMSLIGATLTLPGIAGVILTIGMAVDANVLIFERIREEAQKKSTGISIIEEGFKGATRTILDSNITTIIAGIMIYQFGFGVLKGFAVTICIGILSSMISSMFITKSLVRWYLYRDSRRGLDNQSGKKIPRFLVNL